MKVLVFNNVEGGFIVSIEMPTGSRLDDIFDYDSISVRDNGIAKKDCHLISIKSGSEKTHTKIKRGDNPELHNNDRVFLHGRMIASGPCCPTYQQQKAMKPNTYE